METSLHTSKPLYVPSFAILIIHILNRTEKSDIDLFLTE